MPAPGYCMKGRRALAIATQSHARTSSLPRAQFLQRLGTIILALLVCMGQHVLWPIDHDRDGQIPGPAAEVDIGPVMVTGRLLTSPWV